MLEYKKAGLDFLNTAPIKFELKTRLALSPNDLFNMFEDENSWGWASIESVEWEAPKPYGEGTTRTIEIEGQGKVQEFFFLFEHGKRMAFRFEKGEMKLVDAFVEDYSVAAISDNESELTWTVAVELRGMLKLLTPIVKIVMKKQFSAMLDRLTAIVNDSSR